MKTRFTPILLILASNLFAGEPSSLAQELKEAGKVIIDTGKEIAKELAPVGEALKDAGAEIGDALQGAGETILASFGPYYIKVEFIHSDNKKSTKFVKEIPVTEKYYNSVKEGDIIINKLWMVPVFGQNILNDKCTIIEKRFVPGKK